MQDNEANELIGRYIHGEASRADMVQLEWLIQSRPEAINEFFSAAELERDLHEVYQKATPVRKSAKFAKHVTHISTAAPRAKQRRNPAWSIAIAAAVALAFVSYLAFFRSSEGSVVARITDTAPQAVLIRGGVETAFNVGDEIRSGDKIRVPAHNAVTLEYLDQTRLTLGSNTVNDPASLKLSLAEFTDYGGDGLATAGKKVRLDSGSITASVAHQPSGRPMLLMTPHATAEVLGTQLNLAVQDAATRLEVTEGKVKLHRLSDNRSADVSTGTFALAGKDVDLSVHALPLQGKITITCDDQYELYVNGSRVGSFSSAPGTVFFAAQSYNVMLQTGKNLVAVKGTNVANIAGLLAEIQVGATQLCTNKNWKISRFGEGDWSSWTGVDFDDSTWANAAEYGKNGEVSWGGKQLGVIDFPSNTDARWIWSNNNHYSKPKPETANNQFARPEESDNVIYFRYVFDLQQIKH